MARKLIDEDGFLKGLYFSIRENKIKEPTIYIHISINRRGKYKSIKSPSDLKTFIHEYVPKWKRYKNSLETFNIRIEDLIPVYLNEYRYLKKTIKELK